MQRQCCTHVSPHPGKASRSCAPQLLAPMGVCRVVPWGISVPLFILFFVPLYWFLFGSFVCMKV